ncbi:molybdate ABC transporter substrate-binding protein [Candidatus Entotheonella serta]|nr:molybdate ABC transporter substrate-binding protein [Candidatus Entotheonella serta]
MNQWRCKVMLWCVLWVMTTFSGAQGASQTSDTPPLTGTLTVFAAASLTESFTVIGKRLESHHPNLRVLFNFAGSQALRTQLEQGAPADVFASANELQMALAKQSGVVQDKMPIFIKNRLVLIVPRKNPGQVMALRDLATSGLKLVLAGRHVPVGTYSRQVLRRAVASYGDDFEARVLQNLVSEEHNVKQVVTKILLGEADAGMAYVSDIGSQIAGELRTIAIPEAYNLIANYPIAVVKNSRQRAAAEAFIDFVHSDQGQALMQSYNFVPLVE